MKKTALSLVVLFALSAICFARDDLSANRYSINAVNAPLSQVLGHLQQQADIALTFDCEWASSFRVNQAFTNQTLTRSLNAILGPLGYAIMYNMDNAGNVVGLRVYVAEPDETLTHLIYDRSLEDDFEPTVEFIAAIIREAEIENQRRALTEDFIDIGGGYRIPKSVFENIPPASPSDVIEFEEGISITRQQLQDAVNEHATNQDHSVIVLDEGVTITRESLNQAIKENEADRSMREMLYIEVDDGDLLILDQESFR